MNTTRLTDTRLLILSIVLSGGIFAIDLSLPLAVGGGVPYVSSPLRSATMFLAVPVAPVSAQIPSNQTSP